MSLFNHLQMLPPDPILSLNPEYAKDPRDQKINLGVGSYKDGDGNAIVMAAVRGAEARIFEQRLDKEYQQIIGNEVFCRETQKLLFGDEVAKAATMQTLGGSGSIRIGAEFLKAAGCTKVYLSSPTWSNHRQLIGSAGITLGEYPYYNRLKHELDFSALMAAVAAMEPKEALLLHTSSHNPTGFDLSKEQWKELEATMKKQGVIPFFDSAYLGFKEGVEEDCFPLRLFLNAGHEFVAASSFSKNMGLYGERIGALTIVANDSDAAERAMSHAKAAVRSNYSSPPLHSGRIVAAILSAPELRSQWLDELAVIRNRIKEMRVLFIEKMQERGFGDYSYMAKQDGLFSLLDVTADTVEKLKKEFGIYMPSNGRINIAGLNKKNINYFIDSIAAVNPHETP